MGIPEGIRSDLLTRDVLKKQFYWSNYAVLVFTVGISILIGVYFAYKGQKTNDEYLMANRSMSVWPIALSLVVSFMSASSVLGYPVEIYVYGTHFALILFSFPLQIYLATTFYLPVFYKLGIMTSYQYLELRFHRVLRIAAALAFTFQMTLYTGLCVYAPALAISQFTNLSLHLSTAIILISCIIYTVLGGLKAVIWTDIFQCFIMACSLLPILVTGTYRVGGVSLAFERAFDSGRIHMFNFELDPRTRHTVWSILIGGTINGLSVYGCNQVGVQRYMATSSLGVIKRAMWIQAGITLLIIIMCVYIGLLCYAFYFNCDPISTNQVDKPDQLLLLFMLQILGEVKCLPGLLVAGLFSASLSSVSSSLTAITSVVLTDILKLIPCDTLQRHIGKREVLVSRCITTSIGVLSSGCVIIVSFIPGVLQAALSIFGLIGGPLLGMFSMAMFLPFTSTRGVALGALIGLTLAMWTGFGQVAAFAHGTYGSTGDWAPKASVSTAECPLSYHVGTTTTTTTTMESPFSEVENGNTTTHFTHLPLYEVSYLWLASIGFLSTTLIGTLVSLCDPQDSTLLDPALVSSDIPALFKWWPQAVRGRVERYWARIGSRRWTMKGDP